MPRRLGSPRFPTGPPKHGTPLSKPLGKSKCGEQQGAALIPPWHQEGPRLEVLLDEGLRKTPAAGSADVLGSIPNLLSQNLHFHLWVISMHLQAGESLLQPTSLADLPSWCHLAEGNIRMFAFSSQTHSWQLKLARWLGIMIIHH